MERKEKDIAIREMTASMLDRNPPATQDDCCLMAARISVAMGDIPTTEPEFASAALGQAKGLFGPAFDAANEGQKWAWIDMCERALRRAAAERAFDHIDFKTMQLRMKLWK